MSAFVSPPAVISTHIRAVNCGDLEGMIGTFSWDAIVNANAVFYSGRDKIRKWAEQTLIRNHVTFEVDDIREQYGIIIISATADGDFDKALCPEPNYLDFFFVVREEKIVLMIVIKNIRKSGTNFFLPNTTI